ncbi:putative methyltransferase-domain-containing protein [Zychaea mexicana]|uniref:putative methyltransferase-domain-containing protein n=1 Tax=Zychaea mexicana TaxID=64656 RepID=UPI0022FE4272|nr:putative methyltransferase-domain-containing protein [Zychaea mexicana]KAI9493155.1 putative methyltransferase-domain-containing protein [Zychaea mexicana]
MSMEAISPLIVCDALRKRSAKFQIQMVEDHTTTDENDFYQSLHRHSILHRLVLLRPFPHCLTLDTWYRIDLEVVNELGLSLKGDRNASCRMHISCQLFVVDTDRGGLVRAPPELELSYRPLQVDAWDSSSLAVADQPGFHHNGQGGIEIKVSLIQDARCMMQYTTKAKYLVRIAPVSNAYQTVDALPLTLGSLELKKKPPKMLATNAIEWNMGGNENIRSDTIYRMFDLSSLHRFGGGESDTTTVSSPLSPSPATMAALDDRYFVVKEIWKMGTPGKIWDSALVLSDMFAKKIMQEPTCLDGKHVLDLSAGTGCIGLLLGLLLRRSRPQHTCRLTLTDLPEALGLIRENHRLNAGNNSNQSDQHIHIEKLCWGSAKEAKHLMKQQGGGPDIVLASDVLYDPKCFPLLVSTLKALCVPGKTVVYLGYKRRGLKREDENMFFNMAKESFDISAVPNIDDLGSPLEAVGWEKQNGFMKRNYLTMDGRGWLGPAGCSSDIFDEARQEGKVIIYRLVKIV